ncbi:putative glycosidase [Rosa chinensis]|uniref:Putative glycosidase n=1 Tax=Rosa chinensis TaxID=74649 RepID=A0A2P6S7Q3_ROSCH|nr:putative glycosidase [Rosa chinensis]
MLCLLRCQISTWKTFANIKDEEIGDWHQHRGIDFKMPLLGYLQEDGNVGAKKGLGYCQNS